MLSCLSCVCSVFYVLGGLVELETHEYNCGLRYLTVSCTCMYSLLNGLQLDRGQALYCLSACLFARLATTRVCV